MMMFPLHLPLFAVLLLIFIARTSSETKGCADFNYGAAQAVLAGLNDVYTCPRDGISRVMCSETFPVKNVSDIVQSNLNWNDIVVYMMIGPNSKVDAFNWWLQFVKVMDFVIVADACPQGSETCSDSATALQSQLNTSHPNVKTTVVRANSWDSGYAILSCKLRTGMKKIYSLYPDRKYYFKIDTDTIVFPRRFFSFLNTLHSVTETDKYPYYFGTITESGSSLILCGNHPNWRDEGRGANQGGLCYAQGGAGYGLNNVAMRALAANDTLTPACTKEKPETWPEDTFTGLQLYRGFKTVVMHCGGFRSSELVSEQLFKHSISFHYIDWKWLQTHGQKLMHHYTSPTTNEGGR